MELASLSDEELMGKIEALAETERFTLVDFLLHLGELDSRKACERTSYATIFGYLTRRLHFAESDAVRRVRVARAARKYPSILRMLARGELHLVGIAVMEPVLSSENHERLLRRASRRSTREIERMVAELSPPLSGPSDRIRALPPRSCGGSPSGRRSLFEGKMNALIPELLGLSEAPVYKGDPPARLKAGVEFAGPVEESRGRVVFTFAADQRARSWFEQARDLLRHRFPMGRMEDVIGEALRQLIERKMSARVGGRRGTGGQARLREAAGKPKKSRRAPTWVREEVWRRDEGRCAYRGTDGVRCGGSAWLEFDHVVPWAAGGRSDDPGNIRLLCRPHNQAEGRRLFGDKIKARKEKEV